MRKTDLSPDRQQLLVPLDSHPGALALVPPPTPTHLQLPNLRGEIAKAHEALGRLQASASSLPNPNLITRTLDRREAVRSSQIEGTSSDLDDVLTFEATGSDEGLPPDVVVTLNYVKALEYGLAKVSQNGVGALDIELIKELHARLMDGVRGYGNKPGEMRTRQNWIGGLRIYDAKFVPPPPDRVEECLEDLVRVLQYAPAEEDFYEVPLVMRMAIVHAQFETIHPFIDGNGRVGRIILPLMLAAEGYPPVYLAGFMKANQGAYYETLGAVQLKGEWTEWVRFVATGVEVACRESMQTAQELTALLAQWKERLAALKLRADAAAYRLPELLIGTPVLTATHAAEALGITFPAANRALAQLQETGIVEPLADRKRNRVFVAKEVVELLSRPTLPESY
ncbi:Fic family protein [Geomonas anaerohicana]|uniref:Fic family protein n=1 Tax=Geomonas anaerohicana TaxID=2798583 RepID=A0ABS0YBP7_9BACT|nr:Fic family protein [Geomonas anaerohicana]MBJ6749564.1 Fic family protein [Geomonas anaerohicana]